MIGFYIWSKEVPDDGDEGGNQGDEESEPRKYARPAEGEKHAGPIEEEIRMKPPCRDFSASDHVGYCYRDGFHVMRTGVNRV